MNEYLFGLITEDYKDTEIEILANNKILIKDIVMKGIGVELMPNNSYDFVIRFDIFNFFALDAFEKYLANNLMFDAVVFKVNSLRIYAYVSHKKDDLYCYSVFNYIVNQIRFIISSIISLLEK